MGSLETLLYGGLVSGVAAGIVMGLVSHAAFRTGIFKSSLIIIDGAFVLKKLGMKHSEMRSVMLGIPVHLFTSLSFGLSYGLLAYLLHTYPTDIWILTFYVLLLWLSMLFVALPVAGHGVLGRRLGSTTWFEQLILHIIFGIGLLASLHFILLSRTY
jgi:hypothetical protein